MSRYTRLFLSVLGCAVCVVALLVIVSSCVEPVGPFDNPYDPENPESPLAATITNQTETNTFELPADEEVSITCRWSSVNDATAYHLQVATTDDFSAPVVDLDGLADRELSVELGEEGRYFWRIRYQVDVDHQGETNPAWSPWHGPWEMTVSVSGEDDEAEPGSVAYNANGASTGTTPTDPTSYSTGATVTVLSPPGDLRGPAIQDEITQRFIQWNTESDGSGTGYDAGASLSMPENGITLYAQWTSGSGVIGKIGPAGGYVFYDDEEDGTDDLPGTRYLEAAPAETEWADKVWGGYETEIGVAAQGTEVGTGAANTVAIVAAFGDAEPYEGRSDYAAKLTDDLSHNGYGDWFLPSKDELELMYTNLHGMGIGGFSDLYWSSSEKSSTGVWLHLFFQDEEVTNDKSNDDKRVRAIRAFPNPIDYGEAESFTVTYDANGASTGTAPTDPTSYSPGATGSVLSPPGDLRGPAIQDEITQRFIQWNTESDGSGTGYDAGASLSMPENGITLYAQWTSGSGVIGKIGPAGGYVFYDDEEDGTDDLPGTRYLEVAPAETEWADKVWGGGYEMNVGIAAQRTEVGAGGANTAAIVATYGEAEPFNNRTDYAAKLADDLSYNGFNDWFLPSRDELDLMYMNLRTTNIGSFEPEYYWSSSEVGSYVKWVQDFLNGTQGQADDEGNYFRVRAIRAFPNPIDYSQLEVEIRFDANGADGGALPAAITDAIGATVTLPGAGTLTRTGHVFAGWNTQPDGSGTSYAAEASYTIPTANTTLYAQWAEMPIMVEVPTGTFNAAGTDVTISAFHMSQHEITQEQYWAVTGSNPSNYFGDMSRPVETVSWYDALVFCNTLSMIEGKNPVYTIDGSTDPADWGTVPTSQDATWEAVMMNADADGYRLPTEAEWEYAAKGGAPVEGYTYAGSDTADDVAWYLDNSGGTTHPVGQKLPNRLNLYDMSGNVWEWCWDWYDSTYPSGTTDPTGPTDGADRLVRGGGCNNSSEGVLRPSSRSSSVPYERYADTGFRVVAP